MFVNVLTVCSAIFLELSGFLAHSFGVPGPGKRNDVSDTRVANVTLLDGVELVLLDLQAWTRCLCREADEN